jgi:NAD(P)-dependent dehydrogenase (short-subunit alcohol dehydrogenase family)
MPLAWRLEGTGVTANCIHPGIINTKLLRAGFGMGGESVEEGTRTPVYLASSPDVQNVSNRYFDDCRPMRSSPISYDVDLQEWPWRLGEDLAGLR